MNNNSDNKFFMELGLLFDEQGLEAAERKVEQSSENMGESFGKLSARAAGFSSEMSRAVERTAAASSKAMNTFFDASSKDFLNLESMTKKVFDNILGNFFNMASNMITNSLFSNIGGLFGGGGGFLSGILGSRESGGPIGKTGPYLLHAGEYVLPKEQVESYGPAAGGAVNITVNTPVNIASVSSGVDVKNLAGQIADAARSGAGWAVEYAKVNYKIGKKREGDLSL